MICQSSWAMNMESQISETVLLTTNAWLNSSSCFLLQAFWRVHVCPTSYNYSDVRGYQGHIFPMIGKKQREAMLSLQAHLKMLHLSCLFTVTWPSQAQKDLGCLLHILQCKTLQSTMAKVLDIQFHNKKKFKMRNNNSNYHNCICQIYHFFLQRTSLYFNSIVISLLYSLISLGIFILFINFDFISCLLFISSLFILPYKHINVYISQSQLSLEDYF